MADGQKSGNQKAESAKTTRRGGEAKLGARVRAVRRKEGLTQAELARRLGISASYLNLIEHDQRTLTADLLLAVAQILPVDLATLGGKTEERLSADLMEAFSDPFFDGHNLLSTEVRDMAEQSPNVARAVLALYEGWQTARSVNETLAMRMYADQDLPGVAASRLPSEEVNDFVQQHMNFFPELEEAAEWLWKSADLQGDLGNGLVRLLQREMNVTVQVRQSAARSVPLRRYDPERKVLHLSEALSAHSRRFQTAVQLGLLLFADVIERLADDAVLTSHESRALARLVLANYFAAAVVMPYTPFLETARAERYDIELLGNRYGAGFEQVCHRLTTLQRPGQEGVPLHFVRVDLAGNISKHFSASGIRFARFSGACPRWNIHAAFLTPGLIRTQLSRMPDGSTFFCLARTVPKGRGGYHGSHTVHAIGLGCDVKFAPDLVYADGMDLQRLDAAVPVGVTCRLCERTDCEQRAFPSLRHAMEVDVNVRGQSPYMAGLG